MINKIYWLVIATIIIAFGLSAEMSLDEQRGRSVKVIESTGSQGSGFFIDGNTVITAKHVVARSPIGSDVKIYLLGREFIGTLTYIHPKLDVALVSLKYNLPFAPVELSEHLEGTQYGRMFGHVGMMRYSVNYPGVKDPVVIINMRAVTEVFPQYSPFLGVNNRYDSKQWGHLFTGIAPLSGRGMSGAGVIDNEGRLMGILSVETESITDDTGKSTSVTGIGGITPADKFFKEVGKFAKADDVTEILD